MRISFHLGAHCTDDGRLVRSALRCRAAFAEQGIQVPPPRHYRALLRDSLNLLSGGVASADVQQAIIDQLVDSDDVHRLVIFHDSLIAIPNRAITEEGLYFNAPRRLQAIQNLFPDHEVEFFIALCNPATLIPMMAMRAGPGGYGEIVGGADLSHLSWLRTMRRILAANLELPVTLWCNEDTPFLWPDILRAVTGYRGDALLEGDFDLLAALLTDEGFADLSQSLTNDPPASREDRSARIEETLVRHARAEETEIDIALAGWDADLVADLTARYETECAQIAALPGIHFLRP